MRRRLVVLGVDRKGPSGTGQMLTVISVLCIMKIEKLVVESACAQSRDPVFEI